jgi:hypothetical protein
MEKVIIMARLFIAGLLAAAAATPLLAQPTAPVAPIAPRTPMAKIVTRADVLTRVQTQFAKRDTNRDGFLTTEEINVGSGRNKVMMIRRGGMAGGLGEGAQTMRDPNVAFDRIDANRDGRITRDEFAKGRQVRIEKHVVMNGAPGQPGAMHAMPGMHRMGGGMMMGGGAILKLADANNDGRVSLQEATGAALRHFDMMDRNRDGRITPDERAAGRVQVMQIRKAG